MVVCLMVTTANAQNLLTNNGFETGDEDGYPTGWLFNTSDVTKATFVVTADEKYAGEKGCKIAHLGGIKAKISQSAEITAGQKYTVSSWYKVVSEPSAGGGKINLSYTFLKSDGTAYTEVTEGTLAYTLNEWMQTSVVTTEAPSDAKYITFAIQLMSKTQAAIDEASVVLVSAKQDQVITNFASFTKTNTDADFDLSATASSGLTVTYSIADTSIATLAGSTVHILKAGTTTITASQAGDESYYAAKDSTVNFTVSQLSVVENAHENDVLLTIQSNPVSGDEVECSFSEAGPGAILCLLDLTSKVLIKKDLIQGTTTETISVRDLVEGLYLLRYSDKNGKQAIVKMLK
jgi:hypothetical protein